MIADTGKMGLDWWGPVQSHPRPKRSWSRKPLVSDWGGRSGFLTSWFLRPPSRFSKLCSQNSKRWQSRRLQCRHKEKGGMPKKWLDAVKGGGVIWIQWPPLNTNWISFFLSVDNFQCHDNRPRSALLRKNPRQNKQNSISIGTMLIKWHTPRVTKIFL